MHQPRAGVRGHVSAVHQLDVALQKRMPKNILAVQRLERVAAERNSILYVKSAFLLDRISQPRCDHVPILARPQRDVVERLVERDSKIRR